ncbi:MAG: helix-turn-helix domain-containing protein, partial [Sandaracinaceae bacterium]
MTTQAERIVADALASLSPDELAAVAGRLQVEAVARSVAASIPAPQSAPVSDTEKRPRVLRTDQAVEYSGFSKKRLYTLARAGRIGHRIDDGPWLFTTDELDRQVE